MHRKFKSSSKEIHFSILLEKNVVCSAFHYKPNERFFSLIKLDSHLFWGSSNYTSLSCNYQDYKVEDCIQYSAQLSRQSVPNLLFADLARPSSWLGGPFVKNMDVQAANQILLNQNVGGESCFKNLFVCLFIKNLFEIHIFLCITRGYCWKKENSTLAIQQSRSLLKG